MIAPFVFLDKVCFLLFMEASNSFIYRARLYHYECIGGALFHTIRIGDCHSPYFSNTNSRKKEKIQGKKKV